MTFLTKINTFIYFDSILSSANTALGVKEALSAKKALGAKKALSAKKASV